MKADNKGLRFDDGKISVDLLAPVALEGTAMILTIGAVKYARHNWTRGMLWSKVIGPLLRHLLRFMAGEDYDKETGLPHVHHMGCNIMFLQYYFENKVGVDDRLKTKHVSLAEKYAKQISTFKAKWSKK